MKHKAFDELKDIFIDGDLGIYNDLIDEWVEKWFEECEDYLGDKFLAVKDKNDA